MPADPADGAMLLAVRAWGQSQDADLSRDADFWSRVAPAWRARLAGMAPEPGDAGVLSPSGVNWPAEESPEHLARDRLLGALTAHVRCDPAEVHPSWFLRALTDESAAVRRVAVQGCAPALRTALSRGLGIPEDDLIPDCPPHPEVVAWVRAHWTERLVGGPPVGPEDAPVVMVLGGMRSRALTRLLMLVGLAKRAYVPESVSAGPVETSGGSRHQARLVQFHALWRDRDPRLVQVARVDLASVDGDSVPALTRLGLVTLGRLLARVEFARARWAIQHLPYPVAKTLRRLTTLEQPFVRPESLLAWESRVLDLAQSQVELEPSPTRAQRP